jgi:DNA processing protein
MIKDLAVAGIPGLNCEERIALLKRFEKEEKLSFSRKELEFFLSRTIRGKFNTMDEIFLRAELHEKTAKMRGIRYLCRVSDQYPFQLGEIDNPPFILYYLGGFSGLEKPAVAVVGTRTPSSRASAQAYSLGKELGRAGITVVSGLALGIDAMAHRGCLDGGGVTLAVLGCGLDGIYPASNRPLARRILENGGALLSEYPPGTRPYRWNFPERNRIISGLALGTVVVEAPDRSGALYTAHFSLDQGRELWAAEAGLSRCGKELKRLIEEGCGIVSSAGDILAELEG